MPRSDDPAALAQPVRHRAHAEEEEPDPAEQPHQCRYRQRHLAMVCFPQSDHRLYGRSA